MAWEKWQSTAADMKLQELALRRGLMRMLNAKLAAGFGSWREQAAEAGHNAYLLEEAERATPSSGDWAAQTTHFISTSSSAWMRTPSEREF